MLCPFFENARASLNSTINLFKIKSFSQQSARIPETKSLFDVICPVGHELCKSISQHKVSGSSKSTKSTKSTKTGHLATRQFKINAKTKLMTACLFTYNFNQTVESATNVYSGFEYVQRFQTFLQVNPHPSYMFNTIVHIGDHQTRSK